jgi:putative membrane protein
MKTVIAGILAAALSVGAALAQSRPDASAQAYVERAASTDLFGIEAGRLAIERSQNLEIRGIGQMLVTDHENAARKLAALADGDGIKVPDRPGAAQAKILADLRNAASDRFDAAFVAAQLAAQRQALELHGDFAKAAVDENLKRHASLTASVVQRHLRTLEGIAETQAKAPGAVPATGGADPKTGNPAVR